MSTKKRQIFRQLRKTLRLLGRPFQVLKPFVPRSLMARSMLILLVPLLALQLVTLVVLYERHYLKLADTLAANVAGSISTSVFMFQNAKTPFEQGEVIALVRQTHRLTMTFNPSLTDVAALNEAPHSGTLLDTRIAHYLDRIGKPYLIDSRGDEAKVLINILIDQPDGVLMFSVPRRLLIYSTAYKIAAWVLGASLLLFGAAAIFMRNQVRPIRRLARAAEKFGRGQDYDLTVSGASEVRKAAESFLGMQQRLQRHLKQRTALLNGVSHDLRTPLTRMKLELAMLKDQQTADSLNRDVQDMERMIESYLSFAETEVREDLGVLDVEKLISEQLAMAAPDLSSEAFTVVGKQTYGRLVSLRQHALERSLSNLIENCKKYATTFQVCLTYLPSSVVISIGDDGQGIPESEHDQVFQPFYRMESSRNSETGGQGLGLSIVQDFVRKHGGQIDLGESELGGLFVEIKLPT